MAADERLKWLEIRINSSLRPRSEDLKNMVAKDDNRLALYEFVNNEDVKQLFIVMRNDRHIEASLQPPKELHNKSVFFLKCNSGTKLTRNNMDTEVLYMDCSNIPLEHLELLIREVFLPLLATNTNRDDLLDTLHGLMAAAEVSQGLVEGKIVLSLPSIEVLAEAAALPWRRISVFHVLETTVIGWIKQIRAVLRHNPASALLQQSGKEPGPLDEILMWERHLAQLKSIDDQLDSPVAKDILQNLELANSQYAHSFSRVKKDIAKAESETRMRLKFLNTMEPLFKKLQTSVNPQSAIKLFKPLMRVLQLVWTHSVYYHQNQNFHHLLKLLSNEVVHRARAMVGEDVLMEPLESYSKLKGVLHMCAAFRGTYLDFKDKADNQNATNIAQNAERLVTRPQDTFFTTEELGPYACKLHYGMRHVEELTSSSSGSEEGLLTDSPWPARNASCFDLLNSFMERCNDVLELVETTGHFRLLADVIEAGGAGSLSFDSMVNDLHKQYSAAMKEFFSQVQNVLDIDNSETFDVAFFNLRGTVKSLERNLSEVLKFAFEECPMVHSQLRLLEVFEGISGRQFVKINLRDVDERLITGYIAELQQVKDIFKQNYLSPPCHYNMPDTVSRLLWVRGLKERILFPMEKMKRVSPHNLEGDRGWQIRDTYGDTMTDLEKFESDIITKWRTTIGSEIGQQLKQPLLIADEYDEDIDVRPQVIHVNLDPQLLLLLKEMHYLKKPPFSIDLPESAEELLRTTDSLNLNVAATRLYMIVSKYNTIMKSLSIFEQPMIERKLAQIDKLLEQGLKHLTWRMKESADFIESFMSLVCLDVYHGLDVVQTNCQEIINMTVSWSKRSLDVFSVRETTKSYTMDELVNLQKQLTDELEGVIVPAGNKIHALVQESYEAVQISQESPAWKNYVDYIDTIVLDGLKETVVLSLKAMLTTLAQVKTTDSTESLAVPILTIRLELIDSKVAFCPPLDQSTSEVSVQETLEAWLEMYVASGKLVKMLGVEGSYEDFISADPEVKDLLHNIVQIVDGSSADCKKLLAFFETYAFLWQQDVNKTFENFLHGILAPNPLRARSVQKTSSERLTVVNDPTRSETSPLISRTSSATSSVSMDIFEREKHSVISAKVEFEGKSKAPSLEEFDSEIDIYKSARDEVLDLQDYYNEGWIRVDLQPIKQVLTTYASKWMWTFTKYLADQVTLMLETLDGFLMRIEPEIEGITGEERDTASFMRMMRLFNEVSAQQTEMDSKFSTMQNTVLLLRKYDQQLPEKSQSLFSTAPGRWNNLKTKVSLAKQRLGPRIQEESVRITKDLETFAARVTTWSDDLKNSKVYQRDCSVKDAYGIIQSFSDRLLSLENEAQDLIELQELLEVSVVNFSLIPSYQEELHNLKLMWGTVRAIQEQHEEWKRRRWQKTNTRFLREETNKQLDAVKSLPETVCHWDVCIGIQEAVTEIQTCLPLIDDLSNPAMRTRHWKQLVRVMGGTVTIVSDTLRKMTLRELLKLGVQQHGDDVRAIVQRAVKDLDIENALKTTEEVWLSKIFDLKHHTRNKMLSSTDKKQESSVENSQTEATGSVSKGFMKASKLNMAKTQCSSISSLPASLLNVEKEPDTVMLLSNTELIFEDLEHHQVKLQTIQSNSAAGSFLDEVLKWQKKLQTIEAVLQKWLEVQDHWVEMEGVFALPDVQLSLHLDANRFALVNKDFKQLMAATEKNSNVLQCCCRKNILKILENMNRNLEMCHKSLLSYLESKRDAFPRFYFLSTEDVFNVVCSGYDLNVLNLYINKLLQNVGSLLFEEADVGEKYTFVITGVQSTLGEMLQFDQAVSCKGQIENWLSDLLNQIKASLKTQLLHALENQRLLRLNTRVIYSAGARKVSVPLRDDGRPDGSKRSDELNDSNTPAAPSIERPGSESQRSLEGLIPGHLSHAAEGSMWILDHVSEIVYLATCIQMTGQISAALEQYTNGNKTAIKDCLNMIETKIKETMLLATSLEREKEELISQLNETQEVSTVDHKKPYDLSGDLDVTVVQSSHEKDIPDVGRVASHLSANMDHGIKSRTPIEEISTTTPLDALGLVVPLSRGGRAGSVSTEQAGKQSTLEDTEMNKRAKLKMPQLPSQIHKLRSLIILLGHFRDLIQRLSKHTSPKESFEWKSQLRYRYDEETKTASVTCLSAQFEYGFEYLGATNREVITPVTEQMFVMITRTVQAHMGVLCFASAEVNQNETILEISKCLGKPVYQFSCNKTTHYLQLQNALRGMASTGCWVCFNDISLLSASCLSLLSQLMSTIICALRAGKISVQLLSHDVPLSLQGACFGVMHTQVPVTSQDMDKLLIYPSAACRLPDAVLIHFRVISITKPDLLLSVEVMLLSQGFTNGQELAKKIVQLHDVCHNMLGTNTFTSSNSVLGSIQNASFYGWSMQTLKGVIRIAGVMLRKAQEELFVTQEESPTVLADIKLQQEERAIVTALQNVFLAQMSPVNSRMFNITINELWPDFHASVKCGGKDEGIAEQPTSVSKEDQSDAEDVKEAVAAAAVELGLFPSHEFQARVLQLSELSKVYQTILVAGPAGCGKSECIKTFAVAEQRQGKQVTVQSIFTKAVQSQELLGYYEENTREWKDGLLPALLRKFCLTAKRKLSPETETCIQILQLDGECDSYQMEQLSTMLNHNGTMVMTNNERLTVPDAVTFIWELCSFENMSPSLLTTAGLLVMRSSDVEWKLILKQWLKRRHETDKAVLTELCNTYLEKIVSHLTQHVQPVAPGSSKKAHGNSQLKQVISHSFINMICTFTKLIEVLVNPLNDLNPVELERYFSYSAVWAFGGTLTEDCRQEFSCWWRKQFGEHIGFPSDGTVFDYVVDNETRDFCKWTDVVPAYTSSPNKGIPRDDFVHTVRTEQLLHLVGLLTDAGKSVMLVGGNCCGKTAIIRERIHAVCSGEVAEVLSLNLQASRFTNARLLFDRLDERLEWKHGRTFVPRGNKKLLCLVDDINLSQKDSYGYQTACELIREHLDDGGFYSPSTHMWRYVKGVTYVTSVNPETTADVPALSQRLLRHFAIFGCPHPGNAELQTIFTALLSSHFFTHDSPTAHHPNISSEKTQNDVRHAGQSLRTFIGDIIKVSVELFERMSRMFLATAHRCHYLFTTRVLGNIFRNICLSLGPGCSKKSLFVLWQHECFWLCGKRMVNEVDARRFHQAFITAVKKQFIDDDQINSIIRRRPPLFFNQLEQDCEEVTGQKTDTHSRTSVSEEDARTDLYCPVKSGPAIRNLLERALDEYNKTHPRIRLALYKIVIEQICRLSRVIDSPHEVANTVLVAEGCPARCSNIVRFAASLCSYAVLQTNPIRPRATISQLDSFKADIVSGYLRAGAKKEKILLLLHEDELVDKDILVFLTEFILSGDITHLFSQEEQTTIINSIRTDVTQGGLPYTRDVAWNYFLRTVRDNFRIVLIACGELDDFQYMCRQYPSFANNVNFIWLSHWSKTQLIEHAMFHLEDVQWMSNTQKENIAHMLASMHLVLRQQDGKEKTNGKYAQLNNTSYEKFVEKFISLANQKRLEINRTHAAVTKFLTQITKENKAAIKLKKQLKHEMVVLEERRAGTVQILSQIGYDTAISEQQTKIVRKQQEKITLLEKRLPDYQVAHERAVYKVIAIVADTKKVVKLMNVSELAEMRAMQKPTPDIEDLLAAVIMLLKSPSADLTWQKGAKRQMANLERFIEELATFDDFQVPESTLALVESYLKKPSFDPDTVTKMTNNSACGALCKWVQGVVRYHQMMISKVKPLHKKVEETTQAVDGALKKMNSLENKRKALETRLTDLARSFEEATIDKNEQEQKTLGMKKMLDTAAQLRKVLKREQQRCQQIFDSFNRRLLAIPGACAMAAAFSTYLGPYHHNFRQTILTVYWPECLRERGIPLVVDSIDSLKGRVVDWSFSFLKTASGASSEYEVNFNSLSENTEDFNQIPAEIDASFNASDNEEIEDKETERAEEEIENSNDDSAHIKDIDESNESDMSENQEKGDTEQTESSAYEEEDNSTEIPGLPDIQEENGDDAEIRSETTSRSEATSSTMSMLTTAQYNKYMQSLIKILIGDITLNDWLMKDFGPWQMENAAILGSSWQRPPMLIDPNNEGSYLLRSLNRQDKYIKMMSLDMENRSEAHFIASLEKAVTKGQPVLLKNCGQSVDEMITPLLQHCNTAQENDQGGDSRMITFYGRQISCHPEFKLYLTTSLSKPRFNPRTASCVTLINCAPSHETLTEDLLTRAFACIRPHLFQERKQALKNIQLQKNSLYKFSEKIKNHVVSDDDKVLLSSPTALQTIKRIMEAKLLLARQITNTEAVLEDLDILKDELYPLARRASLLYFLMCSLTSICPAYQFTMKYFLCLFDEAIGKDYPADFLCSSGDESSEEADTENEKRQRESMFVSKTSSSGRHEEISDTSLVQELRCSEPEHLPTIEVPRTVSLPSEGVEYTSYPKDKVKQLMDTVTSLIYHRVKRSLFEDDQLLFTALLLFSIKVESGDITTEELSFLLQGNPGLGVQLTLADFDCKETPPEWLPMEKWEDILAISVLPGPMDSLCVDFAMYSHQWKEWYNSLCPEKLPLPFGKIKGKEGNTDLRAAELGDLNDFHQLLILRMLRPDRLPAALVNYIHNHLNVCNPKEEKVFNVGEVLADARKHWGVLVLLPPSLSDPNSHHPSRIKLLRSPAEELVDLAEAVGIPISRAVVSDGAEITITEAINEAVRNEGWAVIESIHLATSATMTVLIEQLQKIHKSQASFKTNNGGKTSKFCIWLTADKYMTLPPLLIQNLLKIAWNSLLSYGDQIAEEGYDGKDKNNKEDTFTILSPDSYLKAAIISALQVIPKSLLQKLSEESYLVRRFVFAVVVVHAILVSRQLCGSVGLTYWYPFGSAQLVDAVEAVSSGALCSEGRLEPTLEDLCYYIPNTIYGAMVSEDSDKAFIKVLCSHIFKSIYRENQQHILVGDILIPVPPSTIATEDYIDWFQQVAKTKGRLNGFSLNPAVEKYINNCRCARFLASANQMFEALNLEVDNVASVTAQPGISIAKLRSSLDICLEQLPLLLDLGDVSLLLEMLCDLPENLRVNNLSSTKNDHLPNSIGYVLLQECMWMNEILSRIRQDINDLQINLVGGPGALPQRLLSTASSLQEEQIPVTWIRLNHQPCTHSLLSWLEDLKKKHEQFSAWVYNGLVPHVDGGQLKENMLPRLSSVWLGGLVSPQALLTAIRQEKANLAGVSLYDVWFECVVLKNTTQHEISDDSGIHVTDIVLENASWDYETNSLKDSDHAGYVLLKDIYLKPVIKRSSSNEASGDQEIWKQQNMGNASGGSKLLQGVCELPVYMNKSRQVQVWSLPVNCSQQPEKWILGKAAFILNSALPNKENKKSKNYQLLQRLHPSMKSNQAEEQAEDEEETGEEEDNSETNTEESEEESSRSQVSHKIMSPRQSPLPDEFRLRREMPIQSKQNEEDDR